MKFFDVIPSELFSPLASPNRVLYADALDVLYSAYRDNLKIREDVFYSMLRSKLEEQLADATFEGEDIDEEELRDISGRARFLIRKLCSKGWFEKERGDDFEEYITVPGYSSRLLELFHQLRDDSPVRGYSYVFNTYSSLKVANEGGSVYEKMAAVYSAYENTSELIKLLQMVYHNVKRYFQMQSDMQDVNQVLASHFDDLGQKVIEAYIRPLKIKDSVPKYRVPIQSVLKNWAEDDALLLAMANAALQDKRGDTVENCRSDLLQKIFWVDERYDNLEHDYLDEIDTQVRRCTRAATQKVENLMNRDQNVRGNLNVLLTALSRNRRAGDLVDQMQPAFQLYEQSFLSEKSLWFRKRPGKRTKAAPVLIQEPNPDADAIAQAGKLRERETIRPRDDSLAKKVNTENQLARSYMDYLLGRVVCCETVEQLRNFKTAITEDGMLYQGYVARSMQRDRMENAFIGHYAVSLRISRLEEERKRIEVELHHWKPIRQLLEPEKEPLFTQFFVQNTIAEKQAAHRRCAEIAGEIAKVDAQLSKTDFQWLEEQQAAIKALSDENLKLNREKDGQNTQVGQFKERIRQLDDELLPEQHRQLKAMQDRLAEEFPCEYQENVGIPQYQQEFDRLKRAEAVFKKFSSLVEQSAQEQDAAKDKLFAARREYADRFKFYAFRIEAMDNEEYAAEQRRLEESELPQYHEKIKTAQESALEQFQNDFLAKLKSSIDQVQTQVKNLNRALRHAQFGTDRYQFRVERNPDYAEYYDMIMAPELMEGDVGLFALPFQNKYGQLIEKLFSQITMADDEQLNARKQSELQENIQRYTDFRTYLKFDLETTDQNGTKQLLSQTLNTKSGGETQTPFYIAVLASFAQLYRVNDTSVFGNTVRLVVFDEAFNKMDSERIVESVRLLRKMGLQAIICTPPDKVADIMPIADCTLLVNKNKYQMHILTFGKEIAQ